MVVAHPMQAALRITSILVGLWGCGKTEVIEGMPPSFVGVGLELKIEGNRPVVVRALPGGPAELAGVQPNDRVMAVDGMSTEGMTLGDVVARMRGEPDTQTTFSLERGASKIVVVVKRRAMAKAAGDYRPQ